MQHRVRPRGPGQESSSKCAIKDRIIPGPGSAMCFCSGHSHAKCRDGPSRQATKRDTACRERTPFVKYLSDSSGFQDKTENERLVRRSKNYILVDNRLMRKNANSEVLLKCISQDDGIKLLDEIHGGSCGNHAASRTLVGKAFRAGLYWPTAVSDAEKLVRHCEGC